MTDYHLGDLKEELTEEQKKISEEWLERRRKYASTIEPLESDIKNFVDMAKSGKATKKKRNELLKLITNIEEIGKDPQLDYGKIKSSRFNSDEARIKVLGAYELCVEYKRNSK
jgi:hypothetical protein